MATIFSKIIQGDIPCYKIAEDNNFFAFLDISPLAKGHTLVVPKVEVDYIFDLDDELLSKMMLFSKKVAKAIKLSIPCERVGIAVIGLEVPHCHIHLCPINEMGDLDFRKEKLKLSTEEFLQIAQSISQNI